MTTERPIFMKAIGVRSLYEYLDTSRWPQNTHTPSIYYLTIHTTTKLPMWKIHSRILDLRSLSRLTAIEKAKNLANNFGLVYIEDLKYSNQPLRNQHLEYINFTICQPSLRRYVIFGSNKNFKDIVGSLTFFGDSFKCGCKVFLFKDSWRQGTPPQCIDYGKLCHKHFPILKEKFDIQDSEIKYLE